MPSRSPMPSEDIEDREFELRLRENARGITEKLSPDRVDGEWEAYLNTL